MAHRLFFRSLKLALPLMADQVPVDCPLNYLPGLCQAVAQAWVEVSLGSFTLLP